MPFDVLLSHFFSRSNYLPWPHINPPITLPKIAYVSKNYFHLSPYVPTIFQHKVTPVTTDNFTNAATRTAPTILIVGTLNRIMCMFWTQYSLKKQYIGGRNWRATEIELILIGMATLPFSTACCNVVATSVVLGVTPELLKTSFTSVIMDPDL